MSFGSHPECIKVLAGPGPFDAEMLRYARRLVELELRAMTQERIPFQKQILAQRLGICRNRIPRLLKIIGLKDLT